MSNPLRGWTRGATYWLIFAFVLGQLGNLIQDWAYDKLTWHNLGYSLIAGVLVAALYVVIIAYMERRHVRQ